MVNGFRLLFDFNEVFFMANRAFFNICLIFVFYTTLIDDYFFKLDLNGRKSFNVIKAIKVFCWRFQVVFDFL